VLFDLDSGKGRLLLARPGPEEGEAQMVWDGLHEHYRGELKTPVAVTREDWPRIDKEWDSYYRSLVGLPLASGGGGPAGGVVQPTVDAQQ
jgi:hypothetical protein